MRPFPRRRLFLPAILACAFLLTVCQEPDPDAGGYVFSVEADSAYFGFDSLWVAWVDSSGRDTTVLFEDKLESENQLRRMSAKHPPQGKIRLLIRGFKNPDPRPVYEEERLFDMGSDSVLSRSVPLDAGKGISRPPVLEFLSADTSGRAGDSLSFRARAADPDGDIVAYAWFFGGDTVAAIRKSVQAPGLDISARWAFAKAGRQEAALEVHDHTGNRVRRQVGVNVISQGLPAIRFAFADTLVSIRDSLIFSAAVRDSDGVIASYAWNLGGQGAFGQGLVLDKAEDTLRAGRSFPDTGLHRVVLRVVDDRRQEVRDTVRVRVVLDPPWAEAGEDFQAVAEDSVTLRGTGGDSLGALAQYAWKIGEAEFAEAPGGVMAFRAPADSGTVACVLRVTDDDGLTAEDTVRVRVMLSDNAYLASLKASAGSLIPAFGRELTSYSLAVPYAAGNLAITLRAENPRASISVAGQALNPGDSTARVTLEVGNNPIPILVLAPNGRVQRDYTLNATRRRNDDAALASLGVSAGRLEPAFSPDTLVYSLILQNSQDSLSLTPKARDASQARILWQDQTILSGTTTPPLHMEVGKDTVFLVVLAHNDSTARTYQVRVTRLPSADAALKALVLSSGDLEPAFSPEVLEYRATVANAVMGMAFRPTVNHGRAKVFLQGKETPSGEFSDTLPLEVGDNAFRLKVVAESGDSGVYQVRVRRRSANADLSLLTVGQGVMFPTFDPGVVAYSDTVASDIDSLPLTVVAADTSVLSISLEKMIFNGNSAFRTLSLFDSLQTFSIVVTAEDGNQKTYSVNAYRKSANANLSFLGISPSLRFTFSSSVTNYADSVPYAVTRLTVTPGGEHSRAAIAVNGTIVNSGQLSPPIDLKPGANTIAIQVSAEDTAVIKTYRVSVYRERGFMKSFEGPISALENSARQTTDGGFIVASNLYSSQSGYDMYVLRTDGQGNLLPGWPKIFGGTGYEYVNSIQQTSDGGFILAGFTNSSGAGGFDVYLLRIDGQGTPLAGWPKTFGGTGEDNAYSIQQTNDGGFILCGYTSSSGAGGNDIYLLRTDGQGTPLAGWPKTFGGAGTDIGRSIQHTNDGGFIVAGYTNSSGAGINDVYLLRTDGQGTPLPGWPKTFGGAGNDIGYSVQQTNDGGFVVSGSTSPPGVGDDNVYLLRMDGQGTPLSGWPRTFGGTRIDIGYSVQQTSDGGIIVGGYTNSTGAGDHDVYLVRTDALGTPFPGWPKTFGGTASDIGYSVQQTNDRGFIISGKTGSQVYLIKTDADGNVK